MTDRCRPALPRTASDLPAGLLSGPDIANLIRDSQPACLVLQAVGFTLPTMSPPSRCALTAPFHLCLCPKAIGCVFSAALSLGSPRVAVSHHRALPCSDFPPDAKRPATAGPTLYAIIKQFRGNSTISGLGNKSCNCQEAGGLRAHPTCTQHPSGLFIPFAPSSSRPL